MLEAEHKPSNVTFQSMVGFQQAVTVELQREKIPWEGELNLRFDP